MVEINFFEVAHTTPDAALPEMLEKTLEKMLRAVVIVGSEERSEALTKYLWEYTPGSFLPHGNAKTGGPENEPIWITHFDERPNQADVLFLLDGMQSTIIQEYIRVCDLFDGRNEAALLAARGRYAALKKAGFAPKAWIHGPRGWKKK